jgi:ATP-dependent DNA helicase RecG
MTEYEVFGYLSSRGQPTCDEETIPGATIDDLDGRSLDSYLDELRRTRPNAGFLRGPREEALIRLQVVRRVESQLRPTLAGLLMFGKYPQEFVPQLMITFLQYFGTTEEEKTPQGARFMDNRRFEGSIPEMVAEAETYIMAAMRKASLIEGLFRRDIPEYPREAVREAIVNAVAHRDYSPYVRGNYVQVRMFADRIEIQIPGGLFGNVTVENMEDEQSTRNARLMRMMEDAHVVENRGSGIRAMLDALRGANLEPPRFVMNPEAIAWLNQFAHLSLNDRQRVALVYLQQHGQITNGDYQRLNRVNTVIAGQELRGLVQAGLVEPHGFGRCTFYTSKAPDEPAVVENALTAQEDKILTHIRSAGSITNAGCRKLLGVNADRAKYLLRNLTKANRLKAQGDGRWKRYLLP